MSLSQQSLMLVGCGNMGSALLKGILRQPYFQPGITVISPTISPVKPFLHDSRVQWQPAPSQIPSEKPLIILFSVKPDQLKNVLPLYAHFICPQTIFISVAAAIKIDAYKAFLSETSLFVRAMPNTPSSIGKGITLAYAESEFTASQKANLDNFFRIFGDIYWMSSEKNLDQVTVLTGCGPAYVYRFIESLGTALEQFGFNAHESQSMAQQMVTGATHYLEQSQQASIKLREQVTSKGGVTAAALSVLDQEQALDNLMKQAFQAAYRRTLDMQL